MSEIEAQIEALIPETQLYAEEKERGDFEDEVCYASGKARAIIAGDNLYVMSETRSTISSLVENLNSPATNAHSQPTLATISVTNKNTPIVDHSSGENESTYRVPKIDLPKFEGSYEKWSGFSDTFKSVVQNSRKFTDSEKLMYLRSCLSGKAAEKIESLENTSVIK